MYVYLQTLESCVRSIECILHVASVTSLSLKGCWLRQISKQLHQIEWSGWWMASGMMYSSCFLPASLHRLCLVKWPPLPVRPWRPDLLSGCKYDPWYYMADAEWWTSLSVGRKSDSPRFVPAASVRVEIHWIVEFNVKSLYWLQC